MGEGQTRLAGGVAAAARPGGRRVERRGMRRGELARSYAWCERLARRAAGNFYHAFRLLPADQRLAMCALYSFLRVADDLADADATAEAKRGPLGAWRNALHAALEGEYRHPLYPALHDTVL